VRDDQIPLEEIDGAVSELEHNAACNANQPDVKASFLTDNSAAPHSCFPGGL
jgi:hypothetical protein